VTDRAYRLGRPEVRGAVFGWRPGQAACVGLGAVTCVALCNLGGAALTVIGVSILLVGVLAAVVPVRGRGADQWAPIAATFLLGRRRGPWCAGVAVHSIVVAGRQVGSLTWPDGRSTIVLALQARGLRALDDEPQAPGEAIASWLRGLAGAGAPPCTVTMLTVTRRATPAADAPWMDPGSEVRSFIAVSSGSPQSALQGLADAVPRSSRLLGERELAALLEERVEPACGDLLGSDLLQRWRFVEGPATFHAAFVIEEWPSGDVDEQVLTPLCVGPDRRTIAIALQVEELHRSRQRTARLRTTAAADEALADRGGFLASAESSRNTARDAERASEQAAGHGSMRMAGVIGIDAGDATSLEAAASRLLADAGSCGARLRRCDGDHRRGLAATIPGWCVP